MGKQTIFRGHTPKTHLQFIRGLKIGTKGQVIADLTPKSKMFLACGFKHSTGYNMIDFSKKIKDSEPDWICQKCVARFKNLMAQAKEMRLKSA